MQEFSIDARIEEEIAHATPYPLVISSLKYSYLILHFPTTEATGGARSQEIDFIVGKQFLITSRYEAINSIHNLHKVFEAEELLGLPGVMHSGDALLERIMRRMYGALREEVETIGTRLERIERDIFGGKERETMRTISEANRILLRFDTTLTRHEEALCSFLKELLNPNLFGKKFEDRADRIEAERAHVYALVNSFREVAGELRETNDSLLSASQNEVMKTLTVITFIILPPTLIVELFRLGIPGLPATNDPDLFWVVLATIAIVTTFLVVYTKRKGWL